ncbi:Lipase (class 3) [Mesorhizobium albiziae]|uniref:Lipase (Class 3) n=1 Tax=Neomesorhizobium albiziae TaxID=335020 RepID=A0A1I4ELE7_9HYPH|nr:hypothetical protein [Mesorhizobium albiziae]GLS32028.1 hypothetical protein GCM10007937_37380 [Mesorhizobium albiziae]SFL04981.1 Lipase (class 3) [Mesorhizobium albiziae]
MNAVQYSFDEFWSLVNGLSSDQRALPYVCALASELAYHHVPQFEIDAPKRAKLVVPCAAYRAIAAAGTATNVFTVLRERDLARAFVAVDRFVIAAGFAVGDKLFVGFRGTAFLFDWRINLSAPLVPVAGVFPTTLGALLWPGAGRLHRGFAEEAVRIAIKIREEAEKIGGPFSKVYLCGHSLGGAVAAIAEGLLYPLGDIEPTHIFGAPRYADVSHYYSRRTAPPLQFKRAGDIVPAVPSRRMGYADHPREFDTQGREDPTLRDRTGAYFLWRTSLFAARSFEPHSMEGYRKELGIACGAKLAAQELTDRGKLTTEHVF